MNGRRNNMENRQLRIYLTIIEEKNVTRAAEKLYLAQPYVSQQLKLLEQELGVRLIERTTRRFQVTEAGRMFAYRARQILDLSEITRQELRELDSGEIGTVHIGCISSAVENVLLPVISEFHGIYGKVNFDVRQISSKEILEFLRQGIIEIGIMRSPINLDEYHPVFLPAEPMVAIARKDCFFTGREGNLRLVDLANLPLLLLRRYEEDFTDLFAAKEIHYRIFCAVEDARQLLSFAERGLGVAIIPNDWRQYISSETTGCWQIEDLDIQSQIVAAKAENHYISQAAEHFWNCFCTLFGQNKR